MDQVTLQHKAIVAIWGTGGVALEHDGTLVVHGLEKAVRQAGWTSGWGDVGFTRLKSEVGGLEVTSAGKAATVADLARGAADRLAEHLTQRGADEVSDSPLEPAYLEKLLNS